MNPDPDPGFWWPKIEKSTGTVELFSFFFKSKIAIYLSLCLHKGHHSFGWSPQPSLLTVSIYLGDFCPLGSGSGFAIRVQGPHWIRIQSGSRYGSGPTTLLLWPKPAKTPNVKLPVFEWAPDIGYKRWSWRCWWSWRGSPARSGSSASALPASEWEHQHHLKAKIDNKIWK